MDQSMRKYIDMMSHQLSASYTRKYKYVDEAIRADDWETVRILMRQYDVGFIDNVNKVSEMLGEKNLYVGDLLSIKECQNEAVYDHVAMGAARGGHIDLLNRMIEMGAGDRSLIAMGAARGGRIDILRDMMSRGVIYYDLIGDSAGEGGYQEIVDYVIHMYSVMFLQEDLEEMVQNIAYGAARGGHTSIITDIENRVGIRNWDALLANAAQGGYDDIVNTCIHHMEDVNIVAYGAAEGGNIHLLQDLIDIGADDWDGIAEYAARGGREDIVRMIISKKEYTPNLSRIAEGAARGGYIHLLKYLIEKGADDWNDMAIAAAKGGCYNIIIYLVKKGADKWEDILYRAPMSWREELLDDIVRILRLRWIDVARVLSRSYRNRDLEGYALSKINE